MAIPGPNLVLDDIMNWEKTARARMQEGGTMLWGDLQAVGRTIQSRFTGVSPTGAPLPIQPPRLTFPLGNLPFPSGNGRSPMAGEITGRKARGYVELGHGSQANPGGHGTMSLGGKPPEVVEGMVVGARGEYR